MMPQSPFIDGASALNMPGTLGTCKQVIPLTLLDTNSYCNSSHQVLHRNGRKFHSCIQSVSIHVLSTKSLTKWVSPLGVQFESKKLGIVVFPNNVGDNGSELKP